jgi:hypothetical protein
MPNNESPLDPVVLPPRKARDDAHVFLGTIHGVVTLAILDVDRWLIVEESGEPGLTADDIRAAGKEVHAHFGTLHAALNAGEYDGALVKVGLSGPEGQAKRKGLLNAVQRYVGAGIKNTRSYVTSLRRSLKWSSTIVGSVAAAFKEEIKFVPGAATAAEAVKEFVEVLLNATEPSEDQPGSSAQKDR